MLTPSRKPIGKALFHGSRFSIIKQCFRDAKLHSIVVKNMCKLLRQEIRGLCSLKSNPNSVLRYSSNSLLPLFSWTKLITEMAEHFPVLLQLLTALTSFTKTRKEYPHCIIGMCTAILCKYRCSNTSPIQKMISVLMYSGHTCKQVIMIYFKLFQYNSIVINFNYRLILVSKK